MLALLLTLAAWMDISLYDADFGYYGSGRVQFGAQRDFWTYPERLSPVFGRVVAHSLSRMLAHAQAHGVIADGEPFTVVELGAGDGTLARDVCDAIAEAAPWDPAMAALQRRLAYRIGERSSALRDVQRATCVAHGERVTHLPQRPDAELPDSEPFVGVVLSNELLDVWAHHRVRPLDGTLLALQPLLDGGALDADALRRHALSGAGMLRVEPSWVPLAGHADAEAMAPYLDALSPIVACRAAAHAAPPELLVAPGMPRFARWAAEHLRAGWVLTIDYGGAAVHSLDPEPTLPHLRAFPRPEGADERMWTGEDAVAELSWPGSQDITAEIDFGHLAWEGERVGLRPVHFGPQGHLWPPGGPCDPLDRAERARVEVALRSKYGLGPMDAVKAAWEVARAFRDRSPGFRVLLQQAAAPAEPLSLGWPSDPVRLADLPQLRPGADPDEVAVALAGAGQAPEIARALRPWGCPIADLDDAGHRAHTAAALAALRASGLLV